jgi:hypothetical protein
MSAILKDEHIHMLERSKTNKKIYRCIDPRNPSCTYYQDRQYLEGKQAACNKCGQTFILTWRQLRNFKPVCPLCTKSPKSVELRKQIEIGKNLAADGIDDLLKKALED